MKIKDIRAGFRRWMSVDAPIREPEYKSKRGWRRPLWFLVHCMENWFRPF